MTITKRAEKRTFLGLKRVAVLCLALSLPVASRANTITDHADDYIAALRQDPARLAALTTLTGLVLSPSGTVPQFTYLAIIALLFDANGNPSIAWNTPQTAAQGLIPGAAYLLALQSDPTIIDALLELTGRTLPKSGPLTNAAQFDTLYSGLYDSNSQPLPAFTQPLVAAHSIKPALAMLKQLRNTPGAIADLAKITGRLLPAGVGVPLTLEADVNALYGEIIDAQGNPLAGYTDPVRGTQIVQHAAAFLNQLQADKAANDALEDLTGFRLPDSGNLTTNAQRQFLFTQLFDSQKQETDAYDDPAKAADALKHAVAFLDALRNTGALADLNALTNAGIPATNPVGTLNDPATLQQRVEFLMAQLFRPNPNGSICLHGKPCTIPTKAYLQPDGPDGAAADIQHAFKYLQALRGASDTTIDPNFKTITAVTALNEMTGQDLTASGSLGDLSDVATLTRRMQFLFSQLYKPGPNNTTVATDAYDYAKQDATAQAVARGFRYLTALRQTPGAMDAFTGLTGKSFTLSGPLVDPKDPNYQTKIADALDLLFKQLFDANKNKTNAYLHPEDTAKDLVAAFRFLSALRRVNGALAAFNQLTGQNFSASGPLVALNDPDYDTKLKNLMDFLFKQLFDENGKPTVAYTTDDASADKVALGFVKALDYLAALRADSAALDAFNDMTGIGFPASGPLADPNVLGTAAYAALLQQRARFLFTQLFDVNGSTTVAYSNPAYAVTLIVPAKKVLDAFRSTNGAIDAVAYLKGEVYRLPLTGPVAPLTDLDALQRRMEFLFGTLFLQDKSKSKAWEDPTLPANGFVHGKSYLDELRKTGAINALNDLTGANLPTAMGATLTDDQLAFLFTQLYDAAGTTVAYDSPTLAGVYVTHARDYLVELRANDGIGLKTLNELTGQGIGFPLSGPLASDPLTLEKRMKELFGMLFDGHKNFTEAYNHPANAVQILLHGKALLDALRATKGALEGFEQVTHKALPASGPLTEDQLFFLMLQLFKQDGVTHAPAWDDAPGAARFFAGQLTKSLLGPVLVGLVAGAVTGFLSSGLLGTSFGTSAIIGSLVGVVVGAYGIHHVQSEETAISATSTAAPSKSISTSQTASQAGGSRLTAPPPVAPVGIPISPPSRVSLPPPAPLPEGKRTSDVVIVSPGSRFVAPAAPHLSYQTLFTPDPNHPGESIKTPEGQRAVLDQFRWLIKTQNPNDPVATSNEALRYGAASNKRVGIVVPDKNSK